MTATVASTKTTVRDAVAALAPSIAARAERIEATGTLPADVLADLHAAGCFRLALPPSHGGLGADLPTVLEVLAALARADGSTGWTAMIGGLCWLDLTELPRATFDGIFAEPEVVIAGAFNPSGSMEPVDGGYRVTGRWGFASGCRHATWLYANGIQPGPDGEPHLRGAVFSPDEVVIEDTWDTLGLRGTGSHHFHVDGVVVPAERTFVPMAGDPCIDDPVVRLPVPSVVGLAVAAVATGIARGALDDIAAIATAKVPMLSASPLAGQPGFQHDLAVATTELLAAQALLREQAGSLWSAAEAGVPATLRQRAEARSAAAWIAARAGAVVDTAHRLGGGGAVPGRARCGAASPTSTPSPSTSSCATTRSLPPAPPSSTSTLASPSSETDAFIGG